MVAAFQNRTSGSPMCPGITRLAVTGIAMVMAWLALLAAVVLMHGVGCVRILAVCCCGRYDCGLAAQRARVCVLSVIGLHCLQSTPC